MKNGTAINTLTFIQKNTHIKGDIDSIGKVHVSGFVIGNINTKEHVVINQEGKVTGTITTQRAEISGEIHGDIRVTDLLVLQSTARIYGNIYAKNLEIVDGGQINGMIYSGKNVDVMGQQKIEMELPAQRKTG